MKKEVIDYFDNWNIQHRAGTVAANSIPGQLGETVLREIASLPVKNPRFIEIACGTGWLAERLVGSGNYFGLDLSPGAIEVARDRIPTARFTAGDFLEWDFRGERFDVGLIIDSIAYFSDQDAAVAKMFELLEGAGYFVLTSVNPFVYSRMSWVGPPVEGQVRKWLSRANLIALLRRHGFELVKFYTVMPTGKEGILKIINSSKINRLLQLAIPSLLITRAKEKVGLGQYFIVIARRSRQTRANSLS